MGEKIFKKSVNTRNLSMYFSKLVILFLSLLIVQSHRVFGQAYGTLQGNITKFGLPLEGAKIHANIADYTYTDSNGDYIFPEIQTGTVIVDVYSPEGIYIHREEITINSGEISEVNVNFTPGTIQGKITKLSVPLEDAKVYPNTVNYTYTDSNGDYIFPEVQSGTVLVDIYSPEGIYIHREQITVNPGEVSIVNVDFTHGILQGNITKFGLPLEGAKVKPNVVNYTYTDSNGDYIFPEIQAGIVIVDVYSPEGIYIHREQITVNPGEVSVVNVDFTPGTLQGRITQLGLPLEDAKVYPNTVNYTYTDSNGDYIFPELQSGMVIVDAYSPEGNYIGRQIDTIIQNEITIVNFPPNTSPLANAGPDSTYEATSPTGALVTLDGRGSTDPEDDPLTFTWSENDSIIAGPSADSTAIVMLSLATHTITLSVDDNNGGVSTDTVVVKVQDTTPPAIAQIIAPIDPVQINTEINVSADFTDQCSSHTAVWYWGDDSTSTGQIEEQNGSGTVTGSHTYTTAGVYTLRLIVTDESENSSEAVFYYVVVYNPDAGFVTGGGWIDSPVGAYRPDTTLSGKANFGFNSKYKKGQSIPEGNTQFHFKVANFKFNSTEYQWLVIAGPNAKFKGSGTINGEGDYGFMLTAKDGQVNGGGGVDKFRIKIWEKNSTETVVYDNQLGDTDDEEATDAIEGGSIVIHSDPLAKNLYIEGMPIGIPDKFALLQNYPNPFNASTTIRFDLPKSRHVILTIYNIMGQEIITLTDKDYEPGYHFVIWDSKNNQGKLVSSGIYLFKIQAGEFIKVKKMSLLR